MAKIRVSEVFFSPQGEAIYAGEPHVWVRFFGCNLECAGFGQEQPTKPSTYILPYKTFPIENVTRMEDLPVWHYGCDSSYSWSRRYRHLTHDLDAQGVVERMRQVMVSPSNPQGRFTHPVSGQSTRIAFTGGEPMLWQNAMLEIIAQIMLEEQSAVKIAIETNGTVRPKNDLLSMLFVLGVRKEETNPILDGISIDAHISISPKLYHTSGEQDAFKLDVIQDLCKNATSSCIKFVCNGSKESWDELESYAEQIRRVLPKVPIWVMPVGATKESQTGEHIANIARETIGRGYSVASRNHVYLFGNVIGS